MGKLILAPADMARRWAEKEAEIARLREREAQARLLILSAPLHMPTYYDTEARNSWVRDSNKWLELYTRP